MSIGCRQETAAETQQDIPKTVQNLNEKIYLKQRDEEIMDALRAKFGSLNALT